MMSYQESSPSITSKSTRQSVYQTNGRPLSEEAIYKAKLKYGIYNNPAKVNLGVDPSASDTAALLASSSDLSIHPYKRELSSEAATAALIAKTDSAPRAWKRNNFAPEAEYAAISAKSQKYPFYDDATSSIDFEDSQDAASSVLKRDSSNVAREALYDLYAFDDIRSGKATLSQFADTASTSTKLTSKFDHRSGLTTSHNAHESSRKMNIGQVTKVATSNSAKTMSSRTNPLTMDSRSGLTTSNLHLTANGAVDISKINSSAQESAKKSMTARLAGDNKPLGIPTASDRSNNATFASVGALASQKLDVKFDYGAAERETLTKNSLVDSKVLLKAISNANATLAGIDEARSTSNLFGDREMNIKAIQIAQANFAKRKVESDSGKINLGGGLLLTAAEINKMAESIVKPILTDLDNKAEGQRALNAEREQQQVDLKQKRAQYFVDKKAAKVALKKKREDEKIARRVKLQADKDDLKAAQIQMSKEKDQILADHEQEFKDQIAEEEEAKHAIETDRSEKLAVIKSIKDEKDAERQAELDAMQTEKDEDVAPLLAELEAETEILNTKIENRAKHESFFNEHEARFNNADSSHEATLAKLAEIEQQIADTEKALEAATTEAEKETAEAELIQSQTDLDHERLERETSEHIAIRSTLEAKRDEKETERTTLLSELKEIKTAHKAESKEINAILPEHLQQEISSDISDEETIDGDAFKLDDEEIPEPPEIVSEPEDEPEVEDEEEPEYTSSGERVKAPRVAKSSVPKKTWEEIKALGGSVEPGMDPLKNISTNEKPPMASVVSDAEVHETSAKTIAPKPAEVKTATKQASAAATARASAAPAAPAAAASSSTPKEKVGFGKKFIKFMTQEPAKPSKRVKKVVTKKPSATKAAAPAAPAAAPVKKAVEEPVAPAAEEEEEDTELKTTFSGFSQGSDINEDAAKEVEEVPLKEEEQETK